MNRTLYVFLAVMVMAAVTYLIRLFPFLVFGRAEKPPDFPGDHPRLQLIQFILNQLVAAGFLCLPGQRFPLTFQLQ